MRMVRYFAYGSNMNPSRMLARGIKVNGSILAYLPGYELTFNKIALADEQMGYANIMKKKKGMVEGILYFVSEKDLQLLDVFEGCPSHYQRYEVQVVSTEGDLYQAITYKAIPKMTMKGLKPSRQYLSHLLIAGQYFLSKEYYRKLKGVDTYEDNGIRLWDFEKRLF